MKLLTICACILVVIAGIHVTVNTFMLTTIRTSVGDIVIHTNEALKEVRVNESRIAAMQAELIRRSPIIEGTLAKVDNLNLRLAAIEGKLGIPDYQVTTRPSTTQP